MSISLTPIAGFTHAPTVASLQFTKLRDIGAGQGGNSDVFLVHDQQLDTQLVMKELAKARFPNLTDYFAEARRLYDSRHKHVVDVKYACETADHVHIAMPYYRGGSLQSVLDRRYLTNREIVRYGLEFLSGLHHVHVRGLVHFDIKPTNVLLDDAKSIADFGLSQEVVGVGLAAMSRVYLGHMPPELSTSNIVTKAADVYQAGVTLYRMCVGNREYERQLALYPNDVDLAAAVTGSAFPDRRRFLPHTPNRLRTVVKKALAVALSASY
jgi:eukaryotic-like serine/threonine-protein kinase